MFYNNRATVTAAQLEIQTIMDASNVTHISTPAGSGTGDAELLAIAGDINNVFEVSDFDLLDGKLGLGSRFDVLAGW